MKQFTKSGFTLVELLIFMALSSLFLTISAELLKSAVDFRLETAGSAAVDLSGNFIYKRLVYDLKRASAITTPTLAGQSGSTLGLTISGSSYTYTLTSGRLTLTSPTATEPVSDELVTVRNFSVTRTGVSPQPVGVIVAFDIDSIDKTTGSIEQTRSWRFSYVQR